MAALTSARSTQRFGVNAVEPAFNFPIKAATKCIQGGIAVLDAGYVAPGRTAAGLIAVGIFDDSPPAGIDNTGGAAGALTAPIRRGIFKFANSAAGDAIAQADVGAYAYIVDDQTVAKTDALATRSIAGVIMQIDSDGVWVEIGADFQNAPPQVKTTLTIPVDLASLINAQVIEVLPGFAGRILSAQFITAKPATTGAKAATLTASIAGVGVTGGAMALTSANQTPQGARLAATAITALNAFTAAQSVGVLVSAVTAFVEGQGAVVLQLG
jgi:hypothetical protein